jgi:hypothetical protein
MAEPIIRKLVVQVEQTRLEMGQEVAPPLRKAVAAAVILNPLAGRYVEDLAPLVSVGANLGRLLAERALAALGDQAQVHSYGKGAIAGLRGELEHAAALPAPAPRQAGARRGRRRRGRHAVGQEAGGSGRID